MDLKKLLSEIGEEIENGTQVKERVVKSYKMKPEWKKLKTVMDNQSAVCSSKTAEMAKEMRDEVDKLVVFRRAFWSRVELDLGLYGKDLRYNEDKNTIEIVNKYPVKKRKKSTKKSKKSK